MTPRLATNKNTRPFPRKKKKIFVTTVKYMHSFIIHDFQDERFPNCRSTNNMTGNHKLLIHIFYFVSLISDSSGKVDASGENPTNALSLPYSRVMSTYGFDI